jgi:hypothetical protein
VGDSSEKGKRRKVGENTEEGDQTGKILDFWIWV